ncbi:MAG TPA: hypothetical protein ENK06_06480 [Gammaproteobacteria bacterium]|nr:hypothetical protein [Gammaproteobacteria bacterium]
MQLQTLPSINTEFKNKQGDVFMVIGRGTQGIVIEYNNGRVELIPTIKWNNMGQSLLQVSH